MPSHDVSLEAVEAFLARKRIAMASARVTQELQQRLFLTNRRAVTT